MHLPVMALGLVAALVAIADAGTPTLILYVDDACETQLASYPPSDSDSNQCVSQVTSGAYSYEITNDDTDCEAEHAATEFSVYEYSGCSTSGDKLPGGCYVSCSSLDGSALNSYLWTTYTEPVDPPKA